jgi:hypothetical protein
MRHIYGDGAVFARDPRVVALCDAYLSQREALWDIEILTRFGYPGFEQSVYFQVNAIAREAMGMPALSAAPLAPPTEAEVKTLPPDVEAARADIYDWPRHQDHARLWAAARVLYVWDRSLRDAYLAQRDLLERVRGCAETAIIETALLADIDAALSAAPLAPESKP